MKWPESLTLIRHDVSAYNHAKLLKEKDPLYQEFRAAYEENYRSDNTERLAHEVWKHFSLGLGDFDTPLAPVAEGQLSQAQQMATNLRVLIPAPDVVFVSPYKRTYQTLDRMIDGWPELREARFVEDERLREQEHGLSLIFNDWRVFNALYPDQKMLRDLEGPFWYRFPQGENVPDVKERMRSWLNTLIREYYEQNVIAVTHHLAILSLRSNLERWSAEEFLRVDREEKPINAGATIYRGKPNVGRDGRLVLDVYNEKLYE